MYKLKMGGRQSIEIDAATAISKITSSIGLGLERREALLMQLTTTGMVKIGNQFMVTYDPLAVPSEL